MDVFTLTLSRSRALVHFTLSHHHRKMFTVFLILSFVKRINPQKWRTVSTKLRWWLCTVVRTYLCTCHFFFFTVFSLASQSSGASQRKYKSKVTINYNCVYNFNDLSFIQWSITPASIGTDAPRSRLFITETIPNSTREPRTSHFPNAVDCFYLLLGSALCATNRIPPPLSAQRTLFLRTRRTGMWIRTCRTQ